MKAHCELMFKKSVLNTSSQWNHVQHEPDPFRFSTIAHRNHYYLSPLSGDKARVLLRSLTSDKRPFQGGDCKGRH
jgi:hypothetical protein